MADHAKTRTYPRHTGASRKAREDGQVARSRDLGHLLPMAAGVALAGGAGAVGHRSGASQLLATACASTPRPCARPQAMLRALPSLARRLLMVVLPLGAAMAVAGRRGGGGVGRLELDASSR